MIPDRSAVHATTNSLPCMKTILIVSTAVFIACAPALTTTVTPPAVLSEAELRTHVFAFADDSMLGRRAGTEGGLKASRYLADHLARAGLEPGGENGTFFQDIRFVRIRAEAASSLTVAGQSLSYGDDFVVAPPRWPSADITNARVVFLGTAATDTSGWPAREALRGRTPGSDAGRTRDDLRHATGSRTGAWPAGGRHRSGHAGNDRQRDYRSLGGATPYLQRDRHTARE